MSANNRTRKARRVVSYHEAGHYVVARELGVEVNNIDMTDGNAHVQTHSASWAAEQVDGDQLALERGLYNDLMVALAGEAAQRIAGYSEGADEGAADDVVNAGNCAGMLARVEAGLPKMPEADEPRTLEPGDPLYVAACTNIKRARAEVTAILKDKWLAVERVAGASRKGDQLTQAQLDHVMVYGQRRTSKLA
jgi:hypothetical protein